LRKLILHSNCVHQCGPPSRVPESGCRSRVGTRRFGRPFPALLLAAILALAWHGVLRAQGEPQTESDPFELYEQGRTSLKSGEYDKAIKAFSSALEFFEPDDRNAHVVMLERARTYLEKGELKNSWKEAGRVLEAVDLDGDTRARALQIRGVINFKRRRSRRALKDFTAAIKTEHDDIKLRAESFVGRGTAFINLGKFDRAVSDLNQAISLHPQPALPYALRGLAYLRKDRIERARRDANKALRMNPCKQSAKIANDVLKSLSVHFSGPDRVVVPLDSSGHIFVWVRFGRKGKRHRFLLDTGATYTLVNKSVLQSIQKTATVKRIGNSWGRTADGSVHKTVRYRVKDAFLFNLPLGEIEVHVFSRVSKRITNLLGAKSLKRVSLSIDNQAKKVEIKSNR